MAWVWGNPRSLTCAEPTGLGQWSSQQGARGGVGRAGTVGGCGGVRAELHPLPVGWPGPLFLWLRITRRQGMDTICPPHSSPGAQGAG